MKNKIFTSQQQLDLQYKHRAGTTAVALLLALLVQQSSAEGAARLPQCRDHNAKMNTSKTAARTAMNLSTADFAAMLFSKSIQRPKIPVIYIQKAIK